MTDSRKRRFLDTVYDLADRNATQAFYRDWAESYDEEVTEQGYITPERCATALRNHAPDRKAPILDLGCGTGVSGVALRAAGFQTIDGADFSEDMLARARDRNIYRRVMHLDCSEPLPLPPESVAHAVAVGVIATGHAPPAAIDHIFAILPVGGLFVFSLNDHTLAVPAYEGRVHAHLDCGAVELLEREYGPHLPGIELGALVYALRKRA